ncbi:MAG: UDP-N-acetylglucosamine pyrophosphorylase [Acidobacteria bacterium]|nr:UDP-N-acetylglucosamine pyrophosphorylase [Acidobacteriota bacterium]
MQAYDEGGNQGRIAALTNRGVQVWGADRNYIAPDVPLDQIEPGAVLVQSMLTGAATRIGRGSRIGESGPARVHDCQIGRHCTVGAGTYDGATFLDKVSIRGYAEVRPGTLLEEQVEAAHSVAFKNTILTATCVTGSLLNYCDLFMSGGTSREDHSEVGSGVIHFNFDPRGDKWGSLMGDVRGVLLRSAPVFVGGQSGIVGPAHIDFGAVVAAGSIIRRDVPADCVHFDAAKAQTVKGFDREVYQGLRRKFLSTARLIGNLWALAAWYRAVRLPYADDYQKSLYEAAEEQPRRHIRERVKRLEKIIDKLDRSLAKSNAYENEHRRLIERRRELREALLGSVAGDVPDNFVREYAQAREKMSHVEAVRAVSEEAAGAAAQWLLGIAAGPVDSLGRIFGE